jgi:NAD(P)-dependent dehydrogenase (short-subunit alcohol dehydrogenase family)
MGAAVARILAEHGADVALVDVVVDDPPASDTYEASPDRLEAAVAAVEAAGRRALALPIDVTDPDQVAESVARTVEALGRVDLCANVSGGTGPRFGTGPLIDVDPETWHRTLDINLTATWLGAQACARQMIEQGSGGAIVNLASSAALTGERHFGAFSAARAGVVRMTEVLAYELAPHGIRANSVCPLGVSPEAGGGNPGLEYTAVAHKGNVDDWVRDLIPLGRMQSPDETAKVIVFLLSSAASFVSGEHVLVSGGARF